MNQIENYSSYIILRNGSIWSDKRGKFLKSGASKKDGYLKCVLTDDFGKRKSFLVHRLVAICYLPNPNNLPQVNHKDGNKNNCNDWNLEWCDQIENHRHSWAMGLHKSRYGENHHRSKVSNKIREEIKYLSKTIKQADLANKFNLSQSAISKIINY